MAYAVADNSPSLGFISWTGVHIVYMGTDYTITNGQSCYRYVFWKLASPTVLQTSDAYPALSETDCIIFINNGGIAFSILDSDVIHGDILVDGSIGARAIAAGAIKADHISAGAIKADHIDVGTIDAVHMKLDSIEAGSIKAGAVEADKIKAGAVTIGKIGASAVQQVNIEDGAVTANKMFVENLAAITANLGVIQGGLNDPNNYWGLSDAPEAVHGVGELRVGTADVFFLVDPTANGTTEPYIQLKSGDDYIRLTTAGIEFKTSIFDVKSDVSSFTSGLSIGALKPIKLQAPGNGHGLIGVEDAPGLLDIMANLLTLTGSFEIRPTAPSAPSYIKVGYTRTQDANSYIDLIGDTTYTDYGMRFIREAGPNAASKILHRGTGSLVLLADDAGSIAFYTDGTIRMSINSDGVIIPNNYLTQGTRYYTGGDPATTANQAYNIRMYDDNANVIYGFGVSGGSLNISAGQAGGKIRFWINGTEKLRMQDDGNFDMLGNYMVYASQYHCKDKGQGHLEIGTYTGILPGYPNSNYPTIKSNNAIYFSTAGVYALAIGQGTNQTILYSGSNTSIKSDTSFYGAVGNDYADALDLPHDEIDPGRVASIKNSRVVECREWADSASVGIVTDTYSFCAGRDGLPIAVAGFVLAHVDFEYPAGTRLTADANGGLTKASGKERVLATFVSPVSEEKWNGKPVGGRMLVKVV